jgi:hypothetical protein
MSPCGLCKASKFLCLHFSFLWPWKFGVMYRGFSAFPLHISWSLRLLLSLLFMWYWLVTFLATCLNNRTIFSHLSLQQQLATDSVIPEAGRSMYLQMSYGITECKTPQNYGLKNLHLEDLKSYITVVLLLVIFFFHLKKLMWRNPRLQTCTTIKWKSKHICKYIGSTVTHGISSVKYCENKKALMPWNRSHSM